MKQPSWTEHQYTDEIVCPYCGYEFRDSWEYDGADGEDNETECGECGKEFTYERSLTVQYLTFTSEEDCEHEGRIYCDKCRAKLPEPTKNENPI